MIVYALLLLFSFVSLMIYQKTQKKIFSVIPFVLMTIVCGLRFEVGRDYNAYVRYFDEIIYNFDFDVEIGYRIVVWIVNLVGGTQQLVFFAMSAATSYFYYKFIMDTSTNFMLSTILYICLGPFYFSSFNIIRQALAVAIFLYSLKYLNTSTIKYMVWVGIASLFHYSALLFLILPLGKYVKNKYFLWFSVFSVVLSVLLRNGILFRLITYLTNSYSIYERYEQEMDLSYVIFLLVNIFVLLFYKKMTFDSEQKIHLVLMMFSSILILSALVTNEMTMLLTRFISYASPIFLVVVPKFNSFLKPKGIINGIVYMGAIGYYFVSLMGSVDMMPYKMNFELF